MLAVHGIGDFFHLLGQYLRLDLFRQLDVDIGPNCTTVETADNADVPIWQEDTLSANIDHGSKPQSDLFHAANLSRNLDHIFDIQGIREDEGQSADHVLDKSLGSESYRQAYDRGTRQVSFQRNLEFL